MLSFAFTDFYKEWPACMEEINQEIVGLCELDFTCLLVYWFSNANLLIWKYLYNQWYFDWIFMYSLASVHMTVKPMSNVTYALMDLW